MRDRPVKVGEDTDIKMSLKTVCIIIAGATAVGVSWWSVKSDVAAHSKQLEAIAEAVATDHAQLRVQGILLEQQGKLLERMDRKLDYATGATRNRPPAGDGGGN